ncbi:MAG: hypothetical protein ACM3S4_07195 [Burkholderiales bacterium]
MYQDPGYCNYTLSNQRSGSSEALLYTQDPYDIYSNLPEALRLIENAAAQEAEDRLFYHNLIKAASCAQDKQIIAGIRDDEMKHYRMFEQIYYEITGAALNTNAFANSEALWSCGYGEFENPMSYRAALQKALMSKQAAAARYQKIFFAMRDRRHINMMAEIITDELRHLGLFNYLYAKNGCAE